MKRCSISWCPWPAKYCMFTFEDPNKNIHKDYYECWFHGGLISWLEPLWDFLISPAKAYYYFVYYEFIDLMAVPIVLKWRWNETIKFLKKRLF